MWNKQQNDDIYHIQHSNELYFRLKEQTEMNLVRGRQAGTKGARENEVIEIHSDRRVFVYKHIAHTTHTTHTIEKIKGTMSRTDQIYFFIH